MYKLLEKDSILTLEIIKYFYKNDSAITYNHLANLIQIDKRTLNRLLLDFEKNIESNEWESLILLSLTDKTIAVTFGDEFSLQFLYSFYMNKSICFNLCLEIFNGTYQNADIFSDINYISKATLYRKLTPLKDILSEFGLELDLASINLINGEEHQIRYFFYQLFWESFYSARPIYGEIQVLKKRFSETILPVIPVNYPMQKKIELILSIIVTRIQNGFGFTYTFEDFTINNLIAPFDTIKLPISDFFGQYNFSERFNLEYETNFLNFFVCTSITYNKHVFETIDVQNVEFGTAATSRAKKWIHLFCSFFDIQLQPLDYFFLFTNLVYIQSQADFFSRDIHYLSTQSQNLKEGYPYFYNKSQLFFSFLKKNNYDFILNDNTTYRYTLLIRDLIENLFPPLKVLVLCTVSQEQQFWLQKVIVQISPIPIEFITDTTERRLGKKDYPDLIISDFSFEKDSPLNMFKHFYWSSFPSDKEFNKLLNILKKIYYSNDSTVHYTMD